MLKLTKYIDKDTDKFCNALLREISELDRHLSLKITKRVNSNPKVKHDKLLRKLGRVAVIYVEHHALYERAAENLRSSLEWRETPPDPTISTIYRNVYNIISEVRYPGSVESKYEKDW